jgi:hypothetical protein
MISKNTTDNYLQQQACVHLLLAGYVRIFRMTYRSSKPIPDGD